ncbi:hypothetical protein BsWGS_10239 [Bradybaena similaris]
MNCNMPETNSHCLLRSQAPVGIGPVALSEDLARLLESQDFADITFVVGGTSFPSHKVILAARSEYFRAMLYGGMKESQPGTTEIELKDTPPFAFSAFLKYIYTGCINLAEIQEENILDILSLSHRFGFVELESSVSDYLKDILSIHNVCPFFDLANMYNLASLSNVCKDYMDEHAKEVLNSESFLFLSQISALDVISRDSFCASEMDIFTAVNKWAVYNNDQDPDPIFKAVRLELMDQQDLLNVVRYTGLFSADAILDAIRSQMSSEMPLNYRGFKVVDENVADESLGASVIQGLMKAALLNGVTQNYDCDESFTGHMLDDCTRRGILIKLGKPYIINTIKLLLWDKDIRYIRVVGTHNTANQGFHLVSFKCYYTSHPFRLEQGLIVPTENVATVQNGAHIIEGVSTSPNALINGNTLSYDWNFGYTCHRVDGEAICIQLAQPYVLSTMRLLLWDLDNRSYSFYIDVSTDQQKWTRVVDKRNELCKSWQTFAFDQIPVTFIRIVGTHNTANEAFHCVHFESPADAVVGSAK